MSYTQVAAGCRRPVVYYGVDAGYVALLLCPEDGF